VTRKHLHFVVPGDIETPTGGYGYDRKVADGLRALGWTVSIVSLPGSYPDTDSQTRSAAESIFAALPDRSLVMVDGLAFARLPDLMARHAARLRLAALVHHPLADEGDLPAEKAAQFEVDEREALSHAAAIICTSTTTGGRLTDDFGVPTSLLHVAPPGTERKPFLTDKRNRTSLLCVASIVSRKGHDVLVEALAQVADLEWSARFVGPSRDATWRARIEGMITDAALDGRIELVGPLDELDPEYAQAGIFVLATRHEGYGMAFAEALASGLPVVGCAVGAVPEVVPPQAGALVPADDPQAFADALRRLLTGQDAYDNAAAAARRAAERLPRWSNTTAIVAHALTEIDR
jgi:glycosyltransferase involved in cell wall biosynthesis